MSELASILPQGIHLISYIVSRARGRQVPARLLLVPDALPGIDTLFLVVAAADAVPARVGEGFVAAGAGEARPVSSVAPVGDRHAEGGADAHVVDVVPVVFAARDGNHGGADEGHETEQRTAEIPPRPEDAQLAGEEEGREAQAGKAKRRVARGEGPPPILQDVPVGSCADGDVDGAVDGCVGGGDAPGQEVGAGAADGVLEDVGEEGCKGDGDEEGEVGGLVLGGGGAEDEGVGEDEDAEGDEEGVDKVPY